MRTRNWRQYNKSLVERGSLTFLIDPKMLTLSAPKANKGPGRPMEFSDPCIAMLLMIKVHYKLPYRMLEGFARSVLEQMGRIAKVPTYSLICKRAKQLAFHLPKLSSRRPTTVIVDATGVRVHGEGEWKVKVHGKGRPRQWIKIHVAIDAKTQEIVGEVCTEASVDDGKAFPAVIKQVRGRVRTVIGDGAYDDRNIRALVKKRGGRALIPPPRNAVCRGTDEDRDDAVRLMRALGGDKIAKSIWGKLTGYSQRVLVETAFSRYKRIFGDRFFSKTRERQLVENRFKCVLLNKMMRAAA